MDINRSEIKNAPYNPRSINHTQKARLKRSLDKHGLVEPIIWNKRTGFIVGGHQRLRTIDEKEGGTDYSLTVSVIDVDDNQEKAINLVLNNRNAQGQFDMPMLQDVISDLIANNIDVTDAGYTMRDIQLEFPDVFLTGEQAVQLDSERELVAEAHEMKAAGKEMEDIFRENIGLPPKSTFMPKIADGVDEVDAVEAELPEPKPMEPEWKNDKEHFKERRREVTENNHAFATQADVMLTLAFRNETQMKWFKQHFNIPDDAYYVDEFQIAASFGIDLP